MNGAGKNSLLLPLALSLIMAALSIFCHHGGILHYEAAWRLPYYLSEGPLLTKLYDSEYLDWGLYQARELSCFFDYLDCKFIAVCVAAGHPHFLSLTHYVFLALISLVLWRFGVVELGLGPWLGAGVLLLFWTAPAVFLGGVFFRSAKIGLALVVVILYWRIFCILRAAQENPAYRVSTRSWWFCFALACAATLFDRQGVFMAGVAGVFLGFWFHAHRKKSALTLGGAFAAALAFSILYNYILDPVITLSLEHYWPDFKYQHLPWAELREKPSAFVSSGAGLYFDSVRFFLGNIPQWAAAGVVVGLAFWALPEGLGLVVSQTLLIWVMTVLMILRHNALLWPDVRRGYYFLPVISMFAMTLLLTISRFKARAKVPNWLPAFLLSGAIAGNIAALPRHDAIFKAGSLSASYQSAPALLEALRNLHNPQYQVPPEVARDRVFRFFHDGYFSKTDPYRP